MKNSCYYYQTTTIHKKKFSRAERAKRSQRGFPDWDALGGARVAIADAGAMEGVAVLRPTDDCFRSWIAETGAPAALIRPDRYVYATIRDRNDLVQKLSSLASSL